MNWGRYVFVIPFIIWAAILTFVLLITYSGHPMRSESTPQAFQRVCREQFESEFENWREVSVNNALVYPKGTRVLEVRCVDPKIR